MLIFSNRPLEYRDSHAAIRIQTPTSQEGGVRPSKKASTLPYRRASSTATGIYQKLSPGAGKAKLLISHDDFDPILINKRYPQESEKQIGRWVTESRGSFAVKPKKGMSPQ